MTDPGTTKKRPGMTALTLAVVIALPVALLVTFLTYLSTAFSGAPDSAAQAVQYGFALAIVAVPSVALIVWAAVTPTTTSRRVVAVGIGGVCTVIAIAASGLPMVSAIQQSLETERLRALPVSAAESRYSPEEVRQLAAEFVAESTSTLDRPHAVRPEGSLSNDCQLGNLDKGTLLASLGGDLFFTFDSREDALAAIADEWQAMGLEVEPGGDVVRAAGGDWLESAEAQRVPDAVDYNLVIDYESICVAD